MNFFNNILSCFGRNIRNIGSGSKNKGSALTVYALSFIMAIGLIACTDDPEYKIGQNETEGTTLTICIPDVEMAADYGASRADEYRNTRAVSEAAEGTVSSLWFFAYADESNPAGAITKITQLTGHSSLTISPPKTEDGYKKYEVNNFHTGNYHIYLLANFDRYLPEGTLSTDLTEDKLNKLLLEFSPSKKLEKNYLPMYCLSTQIKENPMNEPVDPTKGIFNLTTSNTIYADMNFLCAKIRYTVLFDNTSTGFSNLYSSNNVEFKEDTKAKNLSPQTALTDKGTVTSSDQWESPEKIYKVTYPSSSSASTKMYFDISHADSSTSPSNLTPTDEWANPRRRAWQGICYLPENLSTNKDTQSYLSLTATEDGKEKTYQFAPRVLERGKMYDLVAKLKKSDFDVDISIREWTMQQLAYTLHGPYSLVVEHSQINLQSGKFITIGYKTDTSISYEIPQIYCTNSDGETGYFDFYTIEPVEEGMMDEEGNVYDLTGDYDDYFRVTVNPNLPFEVIWALMDGNGNLYTDEAGVTHSKESLGYFHVVAGNLHKKIDVTLNLQAFLNVFPRTITIDTREYYMSVTDSDEIIVRFFTNYDNRKYGIDFHLCDDDSQLVGGLGDTDVHGNYDLQLELGDGIDRESAFDNKYPIVVTEGEVRLKISNMIGTHDFWKNKHEYTLMFELKVRNPLTGDVVETINKDVKIIIKPYVTNYIIHFKDGTGTWNGAVHTFIYQDLLLPSDLTQGKRDDDVEIDASKYAGRIVGFVELDPNNNGKQGYNAATQYVFSNNISFRGWKGYGGPDINNPYDIYEDFINNPGYPREGFIMLGKPSGEANSNNWVWNEKYGYTNRNKQTDTDGKQIRTKMYRYDVNFNEDHEQSIETGGMGWQCGTCLKRYNNSSRYNSTDGSNNHDYDYPGIVMEKEKGENAGWWKYTLTGVASPGKTMIIFAETEAPWGLGSDQNDHRFPGDYDTGLPLFDFEDNEGWFIFNGKNTKEETKTRLHFFDEKEDALKAYNLNN